MKKCFIILWLVLSSSTSSTFAQVNFGADLRAANPIEEVEKNTLPLAKKDSIHQIFLKEAIAEKDELKQMYAYFYLFSDYMAVGDYAKASEFLLEAKYLADKADIAVWKGQTTYRQGILFFRTDKKKEAKESYRKAIELCKLAGDSLCVGENWQQLGALESTRGDAQKGLQYYEKGMRLVEKYGTEKRLLGSYINYGIVLSNLKKIPEAISYYEKALVLCKKNNDLIGEGKTRNNIADAYFKLGQLDKAIAGFKACIQFNQRYGLAENRVMNYMGLYRSYVAKNDYQSANKYLIEHIDLRDSLYSQKIQKEIAELKALHEVAKKEVALQKSQVELQTAQQFIERGFGLLIFLLLLIGFGIWRWRLQTKQAARDLAENQASLNQLTRLLLEKNTLLSTQAEQITTLEEQAATELDIIKNEFEENLYNQRILTAEDWAAFKVYFEKTYSGYLMRLRTAHPTLSEAEERLFLFIKLNLTRKEIAAILGISADSVKKTRSRLRKRLQLEKAVGLDDYIRKF